MTSVEKGKFCSVCCKTVRDFREATDDEIIDAFSNATEEICGNFKESQLGRDLHYTFINSLFIKFAVGVMMTTGGLVSIKAQQAIKKDTLETPEIEDVVVLGGMRKADMTNQKLRGLVGGGQIVNDDGKIFCVVDGKVISLEELNKIDPKSVKSIDILKDGADPHDGKTRKDTIIVTTKKKRKNKTSDK